MIRYSWAKAILAVALVSTGCGGGLRHPAVADLSLEGQAAVAGRQVVAAVSAAADGVDSLIVTGLLPSVEGVQVLQVLRTAAGEAQRLAAALDVLEATRENTATRETAILKVSEIIKGLQKTVLRGIVPVGGEANRGKVAAILGGITDALAAIGLVLPGDQVPAVAWGGWAFELSGGVA